MICGAKDKEGVSDQRKHGVQHESEACTTFNIGSEAEPRAGTPAPLKSAWRAAGLGGAAPSEVFNFGRRTFDCAAENSTLFRRILKSLWANIAATKLHRWWDSARQGRHSNFLFLSALDAQINQHVWTWQRW
jgi:hypothetical protein